MKRIWKYFISVTLIMGILLVLVQTQTKAEIYTIDRDKIPGVNDYSMITYEVKISGTDITYQGARVAETTKDGVPTIGQLVILDSGDVVITNNVNIGTLILPAANSIDVGDGVTADISTLIALDKNTKIMNDIAKQYQVANPLQAPNGVIRNVLTPEEQEDLGRYYAGSNWENTPESSVPSSTIIVDATRTPEIVSTRMTTPAPTGSSSTSVSTSSSTSTSTSSSTEWRDPIGP